MEHPEYQLGSNRTRIQIEDRGMGMLGYGMVDNTATHARSDLYVRSLSLRDPEGQVVVFANAEICFVTQAIQQAVQKRLQKRFPELQEHQLMLTAQHTHSAPGGLSHYAFYNITVPGFQPAVFEAVVTAFVTSIEAALQNMQPGRLSFGQLAFAPEMDVAFNRSLAAYNHNPENLPLRPDQTHLAIDRSMYLLRAENSAGQPLAVLNWFGVHATSFSSDNHGISSDNKGYAARLLEEYFLQQGSEVVCIFAQAAAGDVSPCFYGEGKNWPRGKFDSDEESCRFNGRLQYQQAHKILAEVPLQSLSGPLNAELIWADFSHVNCDPAFTGGRQDCHTAPAAHGVAFLQGTAVDGPGIAPALGKLVTTFSKLQHQRQLKRLKKADPAAWQALVNEDEVQAPKAVAIESGHRRFLGLSDPDQLPLPDWADQVIGELKRQCRAGAMREHSWTPQVLPLQLLRLGQVVLVAFPGEITTTAARRLSKTVQQALSKSGVEQVVISSYANTYFGYTNTPEEYLLQTYEGGHNVFGRWTLPAFQTLYQKMAQEFDKPYAERQLDRHTRPPVFSDEELRKRTRTASRQGPQSS